MFDEFPYHQSILHKVEPEYDELPGWDEDIRGARSFDELPAEAQRLPDFIAEFSASRSSDRRRARRATR